MLITIHYCLLTVINEIRSLQSSKVIPGPNKQCCVKINILLMPLYDNRHNSAHRFTSTEVFPFHFKNSKRRPQSEILNFKFETVIRRNV